MAKNLKKVRIFSALEVGNICGVVNQTAINWIKSNYLKAFMTPGGQYRVYSDDLYHFLKSRGMRIPEELELLQEKQGNNKKLLLVEDDVNLNNVLKRYFARQSPNYEIYQAFDGFEAGKLISQYKPSIIVLDINLPGIDGYKLCRKIKSDPSIGNPVIIAITGLDDLEIKKKILKEGADAFLAKPFEPQALLKMISEMLK